MWERPRFLSLGPTLRVCCHHNSISTDASLTGWGAFLDGCPAHVLWEDSHLAHKLARNEGYFWHWNIFFHNSGATICWSMAAVAVPYINHQGALCLHPLFKLVQQILLCRETRFLSLRAIYIPGSINQGGDLLSRQELTPGGPPIPGTRGDSPPPPWDIVTLGLAPDQLLDSGLSAEVVETILNSKAPSTKKFVL